MRINNTGIKVSINKQNFKGLASNYLLNSFYDANAVLPTLLIETGVTTGRSYEANKRGGKKEATERLVEQGISALVWLYGVQALRKVGNFIGQKFLNIKNVAFDVGSDYLRNPMKFNDITKKDKAFKIVNTLASTAIATIFIGFILPKINYKISSSISNDDKNKNKQASLIKQTSLEEYKNKIKKENKNLNFTSLLSKSYDFANLLETNSTARLFVTDTGVIAGRYHNGRNKYEKIEGLFRDISSIFFYLASTPLIVYGLNKIAKNTNINPKAQQNVVQMLKEKIPQNQFLTKANFLSLAKGELTTAQKAQLDDLFKDRKIVSLSDFEKTFNNSSKAQKMTQLQPFFEQNPVLTKEQASDVLKTSWISEPEFLRATFNKVTKGASDDKTKFVSAKYLNDIRIQMDNFLNQIDSALKQEDFKNQKELLKKIDMIANKNLRKNFAFNIFGTLISAFALGILIPKIQYFISRKLKDRDEKIN